MLKLYAPVSFLLLSILVCAGCQRTLSLPERYPVNGKVLLNGQPFVLGRIDIQPTVPGKGVNAFGIIQTDGTFQLHTSGNEGPDGAVPGEYKASITPWSPADAATGLKPKGIIPTVVPSGVKTSDIPLEIKAEDNELTIDLK